MTPAVRRAYEWLFLAHLFGATVVYFSTRPEPSWASAETMVHVARRGAVFIDIRSPMLHSGLGIPNSINIPTAELASRIAEVPHGQPVVVFGGIGNDSTQAYEFLHARGYDVYDLGPYTRMPRPNHHHAEHAARTHP